MKRNRILVGFVTVGLLAMVAGCAKAPIEKDYATEPTGDYEITYLLTEFERMSNRNAEGNYNVDFNPDYLYNPVAGYMYTYDDVASAIDDIKPYAAQSDHCTICTPDKVEEEGSGECCTSAQADAGICEAGGWLRTPDNCNVTVGIKHRPDSPLNGFFGSEYSFNFTGMSAGDGVGWGIYFSDATVPTPGAENEKESRPLGEMGAEGITFWAKGNAEIHVVLGMPETAPIEEGGICDEEAGEKCFDAHHAKVKLDGEWREYWITWDEFKQEGWGIQVALDPDVFNNIQFKVAAPERGATSFDVWLDHVGFYGGTEWAHTTFMKDTEEEVDTVPEDTGEPMDSDTMMPEDSDTMDSDTMDTDTMDTDTNTDTMDTDT